MDSTDRRSEEEDREENECDAMKRHTEADEVAVEKKCGEADGVDAGRREYGKRWTSRMNKRKAGRGAVAPAVLYLIVDG